MISRPICTNYMAKANLKATKIRLGNQCIMVETIDQATGKKGIKVIKNYDRKDQEILLQ